VVAKAVYLSISISLPTRASPVTTASSRPAAEAEGVDVELIDLITSSHSISNDHRSIRKTPQVMVVRMYENRRLGAEAESP